MGEIMRFIAFLVFAASGYAEKLGDYFAGVAVYK